MHKQNIIIQVFSSTVDRIDVVGLIVDRILHKSDVERKVERITIIHQKNTTIPVIKRIPTKSPSRQVLIIREAMFLTAQRVYKPMQICWQARLLLKRKKQKILTAQRTMRILSLKIYGMENDGQ